MKTNSKRQIILASASPRRRELLGQLGLEFKIAHSNYEEDMEINIPPAALARFLSRKKAEAVATNFKTAVIIAADTFIALDNKLLGKPKTQQRSKQTLRLISGRWLKVITGYTIIGMPENKIISRAVASKVYIKKLSSSEITNYVNTGEPLDKAGAFGIQGIGALIVEKISGDYNNIVGLPVFSLAQDLKKFGINII